MKASQEFLPIEAQCLLQLVRAAGREMLFGQVQLFFEGGHIGVQFTIGCNGDGFGCDEQIVAGVGAQTGEDSAQIGEGLGGGAGVPKQIGQKFPALGAGVAGQIDEKGDGFLTAQSKHGLTIHGQFQRAEQVELKCRSHCFGLLLVGWTTIPFFGCIHFIYCNTSRLENVLREYRFS